MSAHSEIRKEDKNNYCYAVFIGAVFIIGMKLLTLSEPKEQKKGRGKLDRNAKCYSSSFLLNLVVSHSKMDLLPLLQVLLILKRLTLMQMLILAF